MTFFNSRRIAMGIVTGFILITAGLFFQNCSDEIKISRQTLPSVVLTANEKPTRNFCGQTGLTFGSPIRVSLIIDMSLSNIATEFEEVVFNLCGGAPSFLTIDSKSSDPKGLRFQAVKDFINTCGQNAGIKFSVMGFGNNTNFGSPETCLSPFHEAKDALVGIDYFANLQKLDENPPWCRGNAYNLQMGTSYRAALSCLEQKLLGDSALTVNEKPVYYTFFLTDGATTDQAQSGTLEQEYQNRTLSVRNTIGDKAAGFVLNPILYGVGSGVTNEAAARTTLTAMARATNPTAVTQDLSDFSGAAAKWCSGLATTAQVSYQLKKLYAINVNAKMEKGKLMADSDADGVSDEQELSLGWSPVLARSSGILDGLCLRSGGVASDCQQSVATCTPSPLGLGLSTCDAVAGQSLFGTKLTGVDTDSDDMPDLLEIIRNGVPTRRDDGEDSDGDYVTNFDELIRGSDLSSSDIRWPSLPAQRMKVVTEDTKSTDCGALPSYRYNLENIPLVPVQAFTDLVKSGADLSHGADENVILVISVWEGQGSGALPYRLSVERILVPLNGKTVQGNFNYVGEYQR